ncbi:protein HID1 isoform X3 [Belonocnema kinseyi]|uniref:protein HID1 isoform X3 n=1 Tax=Belonocnema kinseyi TaxID=2817044 RepID=UPI00143D13BA|nr:protein HID1 isoform X3 [Belonocnema kinseyi]
MGNADTKLNFRKAVVQLTSKTQEIDANDDTFWDQFWCENVSSVQDIFTLIPASEIRVLREEAPLNLGNLCYKAVEKLVKAVDCSCRTQGEHQTVLNCCRLLTRVLPYIFEDPDWKGFFWESLPGKEDDQSMPLAHSLLNSLCDLLFCPDFTVALSKKLGPDKAEELQSVDSCEYIWEAGVGFAHSPPRCPLLDSNRTELLKLILTCFSETMYSPPIDLSVAPNRWIQYLTGAENRHALPMFTSLLNTVCAYDPVGLGVPYNHLLFTDSLEPLVDVALQILIVTLDHDTNSRVHMEEGAIGDNLFINYLSRIHRDEDFQFVLKGITRLLNNPLMQTYLPNSTKKVHFHQELLVLFWKMCDYNKKFLYYVLKSSDVLEVLVPILYHLNDSRADQSRVGLMHIGVFILLLLSGERNFGVRLNKPYTATVPMDIPVFTGIENMTEKESAHPLSPSVDVDSSEEISRRDSKTLSEESSSFCKTNFIVSKGGIRIGEHSSLDVNQWIPSVEWVCQWKNKLPLQTIMRLLQVLVPQVEKICIDKGLTDESEILKFLQHGTLVGLLPVPHPILIRRYQANAGTTAWFRTYMWGVIYLRNVEPPIWYDTDVKLFEIQRV